MGNFIKNPEYFEDFLHNMNEAQKKNEQIRKICLTKSFFYN